jgi:hypothetical protein
MGENGRRRQVADIPDAGCDPSELFGTGRVLEAEDVGQLLPKGGEVGLGQSRYSYRDRLVADLAVSSIDER